MTRLSGSSDSSYLWEGVYNGTKNGMALCGYVVGGSEDAYPDKGELDGAYYVSLNSEESAGDFAYGTVTLASASSTITVAHDLGVSPAFAGVHKYTSTNPIVWASLGTTLNINGTAIYENSSGRLTTATSQITKSASSVIFKSSSYSFPSGTYFWYVAKA